MINHFLAYLGLLSTYIDLVGKKVDKTSELQDCICTQMHACILVQHMQRIF